ncbi:MAG: hypothetical protein ABIT64_03270 [Lysobacteraceae bacterium]
MRPARIIALAIVSLLAVSGLAWAGHAQDQAQHASPPPAAAQRGSHDASRDDLPASVRRIQRETGGEVLKAQPIQRDGREVYRVKILTPQGRIRIVEDDSKQGSHAPPAEQAPPRDHVPE